MGRTETPCQSSQSKKFVDRNIQIDYLSMKKFFSLLFLTLLMLGILSVFVSQSSFAAKSEKAQGPHQKTTGEFVGLAGTTRIEMKVTAHDTSPAKGQVYYSNSTGKYFEGKVTGYLQIENKSVFVGEVTNSNFSETQKYFKVWAYDAGEGEIAEPDMFRVVLYISPQGYSSVETGYGASVIEGNIQVH